MINMFYMKDLNKQSFLISVTSKSVEKRGSCWRLNGSGHIVGLVASHRIIKYA